MTVKSNSDKVYIHPAASKMHTGAGLYVWKIKNKLHSLHRNVAAMFPSGPLQKVEVLHLFTWYTHTQPRPAAAGPVKGRWQWHEHENEMATCVSGTQDGKCKRERKEQTPTPTHLAQSGQTLKGKGKERRTDDGPNPDQSAWHNLQGESQNLPQPDLRRTGTRME
jgi:hypothetical protein